MQRHAHPHSKSNLQGGPKK